MRGISLYIGLMVMGILLALALGTSTILLSQLKMMEGMGDSVIAFYAANTGIERELYEDNATGTSYSGYLDLNQNGARDGDDSTYEVTVIDAGGNGCPAEVNYCIKSIGIYKQIRRAIRITR